MTKCPFWGDSVPDVELHLQKAFTKGPYTKPHYKDNVTGIWKSIKD